MDALAGGLDSTRVRVLGEYLDERPVPPGDTVYKSIGSPEQDVVLAANLVQLLADQQIGGRVIDSLTAIKRNL